MQLKRLLHKLYLFPKVFNCYYYNHGFGGDTEKIWSFILLFYSFRSGLMT